MTSTIALAIYATGTALFLYVFSRRTPSYSGAFSIGGRNYSYSVSDAIPSFSRQYAGSGMVIRLPVYLPQMYIDGYQNNRFEPQEFQVDRSQRIQLEGDFNKYFQVYIPQGSGVLALSLLSPDVMQTILMIAPEYDIEFDGQSVRILSRQKLGRPTTERTKLIKAAETFMAEIDHRLQSWSVTNSVEARSYRLTINNEVSLKIGRQAYGFETILFSTIVAVTGLAVYWIGYGNEHAYVGQPTTFSPYFAIAFLLFPCLWVVIIVKPLRQRAAKLLNGHRQDRDA